MLAIEIGLGFFFFCSQRSQLNNEIAAVFLYEYLYAITKFTCGFPSTPKIDKSLFSLHCIWFFSCAVIRLELRIIPPLKKLRQMGKPG